MTKNMWAARDKDGDLFLFMNKPEKKQDVWIDNTTIYGVLSPISDELDAALFSNVKWEDDEPTEIEIKIKK